MATTSSLPVSTILRTVWDDFGELSVRLRSQSIIAFATAALFGLIGGAYDVPSGIGSLAADVLSALLVFLIWTCCTIVSARLFMIIGDRVKSSGAVASD